MKKRRNIIKLALIGLGIVILIAVCFFLFNSKESESVSVSNSTNSSAKVVPSLSKEQISTINETVLTSEFVKDLPENGIIALKFYDFSGEQRIWRKQILIGRNGFLNSGKPDMVLIMHSRYISELNETNLCDVISSAKGNGEMWVESEYSDAKLFLKYSSMMKYKDCLGF